MLVGCLFCWLLVGGCLIGWSFGWRFCLLVGCLVAWLVVCCLVVWLVVFCQVVWLFFVLFGVRNGCLLFGSFWLVV